MENKIKTIEFKILKLDDLSKLEPLFEQAPHLTLNRETYKEWFNKKGFRLYSFLQEDNLLATLGATRNYSLDYRNLAGEAEKINGTYVTALWTNNNGDYKGLGNKIIDRVIELEGSRDNLIGIISKYIIDKNPCWKVNLPSFYTERGFERIGTSPVHDGPVIIRVNPNRNQTQEITPVGGEKPLQLKGGLLK